MKGQHDGYRVTAKPVNDVVPGHWYYGFTCKGCGNQYAVFDDKSQGKGEIEFEGGEFVCDCPLCADCYYYGAAEMQHFQAK